MTGRPNDKHDCQHGFDPADAVFVKKLRSSTESLAWIVVKAVLGLVGLGLLIMFVIGALAVGWQALHRTGLGG